jgi:hypothetical protein
VDPPDQALKTDSAIWSNEVSTYVKRRAGMEEGLKKVFPLILGQCTDSMRSKLEGFDTYATISGSFDTIELLKLIKTTVYKFQSQRHPALSIHQAKRQFYLIKQDRHVPNNIYMDQFRNNTNVIEHIGCIIGEEPTLLKIELDKQGLTATGASADEMEDATDVAKQQYLAIAFLAGADRAHYGKLLNELENSYLKGRDEYPTTLNAAYNLLVHYVNGMPSVANPINTDGVAFTVITDGENEQGTTLATDGKRGQKPPKDISHITCYNCNEKGHYSGTCPQPRRESGTQMLMAAAAAGEFDDNDDAGAHFSFCLVTQPRMDYK